MSYVAFRRYKLPGPGGVCYAFGSLLRFADVPLGQDGGILIGIPVISRCSKRLVTSVPARIIIIRACFIGVYFKTKLQNLCTLNPSSRFVSRILSPNCEVQAIWFSFDGDWRRPPLLEQV